LDKAFAVSNVLVSYYVRCC